MPGSLPENAPQTQYENDSDDGEKYEIKRHAGIVTVFLGIANSDNPA